MFSLLRTLHDDDRMKYDDIGFQFDDQYGCCGISVVYGLEDYHLSQVKQSSELFIKYIRRNTTRSKNRVGMYVCSVNQEMYPVWEPILTKSGFIELSQAVNGKTCNRIYLFNKVIRPVRKPRKVKGK